MISEFKLATQHEKTGYYAKLCIEIEPTEIKLGELIIECDKNSKFYRQWQRWQTSIKFGLEYAWEHIPNEKKENSLKVKVLDIDDGHIVDCSNAIIAFVSIFALWQALEFNPTKKPSLDKKTGVFLFPR